MDNSWVPSTVPLIAGIVFLSCSFIGWGHLVWRLMRLGWKRPRKTPWPDSFFELGIVGIAAVYAVAVVISLFSAFTPLASDLVVGTGLFGYGLAILTLRAPVRFGVHLGLLIVLACFTGICAALAPVHYDAGLYYLQLMDWFRNEPVPLGLANIHLRFGFNSSWLALAALVGNSRIHPDATFLLNSAITVVACGALLRPGLKQFLDQRLSFGGMLGLVSAILFLSIYAHPYFAWIAASPSTDVPAALMAVYSLVSLAVLLDLEPNSGAVDPKLSWRFALCAIAAVMAATIKLSHLPVALAVGIAAWRLRTLSSTGQWLRVATTGIVLTSVLGGLWILHGLMFSGCVLFPVGASCAEWIPWSVDPAAADGHAYEIVAWARAPILGPASAVPGGLEWIPLWLEHMWPYRQFVVHLGVMTGILAVLGAILWATGRTLTDVRFPASGFPWCFGLSLAGLLLCAFSAPDPRFAIGFLIGVAGCLVARLVVAAGASLLVVPRWAPVAVATAILTVSAGYSLHQLIAPLPPGAQCCAWRRLPVPEHEVVRLQGGLDVKVPTAGDQCWSLAGPCTPRVHLNENIIRTKQLGRSAFVR